MDEIQENTHIHNLELNILCVNAICFPVVRIIVSKNQLIFSFPNSESLKIQHFIQFVVHFPFSSSIKKKKSSGARSYLLCRSFQSEFNLRGKIFKKKNK